MFVARSDSLSQSLADMDQPSDDIDRFTHPATLFSGHFCQLWILPPPSADDIIPACIHQSFYLVSGIIAKVKRSRVYSLHDYGLAARRLSPYDGTLAPLSELRTLSEAWGRLLHLSCSTESHLALSFHRLGQKNV